MIDGAWNANTGQGAAAWVQPCKLGRLVKICNRCSYVMLLQLLYIVEIKAGIMLLAWAISRKLVNTPYVFKQTV